MQLTSLKKEILRSYMTKQALILNLNMKLKLKIDWLRQVWDLVFKISSITVKQRNFGRPKNLDYLLEEGELLKKFEGWEIIDYFEGVKVDPTRSIASLVARKP